MLEPDRQRSTAEPKDDEAVDRAPAAAPGGEPDTSGDPPLGGPPADESLVEKVAALIDNARNYAEAEVAFQKTRVALTGRNAVGALAFVILALVLFHIAIIALAVGFVIALAPFVTIWGAIAIVVSVLLLATGLFAWRALVKVRRIGMMFDRANAEPQDKAAP